MNTGALYRGDYAGAGHQADQIEGVFEGSGRNAGTNRIGERQKVGATRGEFRGVEAWRALGR